MNLTAQGRLREWAQMVDAWRASGMKQREFCKRNGIGYDAFKYRKRKVEMHAADLIGAQTNSIVAVNRDVVMTTQTSKPVSSGCSIEIEIDGARIRATNEVSEEMLRTAIGVLRNV